MPNIGISLFFIVMLPACWTQYEGESCSFSSGGGGRCNFLDACPYALNLIKVHQKPQLCGFQKYFGSDNPVVCCPSDSPGAKSHDKCRQYYPEKLYDLKYVFRGVVALSKEFPHMAVLGYGTQNDIQWLCGGSLISEKFVLTAAHCVNSPEFGTVQWVRLGDLDIKNTTDDAEPQNFSVAETFVHPQWRPPLHYHDIALLRLDKNVKFTDYVKPACLQLFNDYRFNGRYAATGWGTTEFLGEPSSHLLKVWLDPITYANCSKQYSNVSPRRLPNGIIDDMQICAGDEEGSDTCPGDSGGPLQYRSSQPVAWRIVGLTSFGKACGVPNSAGVYTRVTFYLSWIENIVWPS